jgi:hypothetical protein
MCWVWAMVNDCCDRWRRAQALTRSKLYAILSISKIDMLCIYASHLFFLFVVEDVCRVCWTNSWNNTSNNCVCHRSRYVFWWNCCALNYVAYHWSTAVSSFFFFFCSLLETIGKCGETKRRISIRFVLLFCNYFFFFFVIVKKI